MLIIDFRNHQKEFGAPLKKRQSNQLFDMSAGMVSVGIKIPGSERWHSVRTGDFNEI